MLSVKTQDGWLPITVATNAYVEKDEEGEETLSFDVPPDSELFTYLKTEAEVRTEDNLYLIKGVNKLITQATITCELNMDDWKASYYLKTADIAALQTKNIGDVLNYIKPSGWTVTGEEVRTIKRTPDKEKCNGYDVLMRCKAVYDVQYDFDCLSKVVTVIDPYASMDTGLYVTPELNMKDHTYKESSTGLVTRLYCYGADDLTFSDINEGKPYIDLQGYKGKPIVSSWTDGRYTNKESLLADGRKKLQELAAPVGSYTINMIDLAAVDDKYKDLKVKIRETAHCIIDPVRGIEVPHRIVKIRKYLLDEERSNNTITLSNEPRDIKDMINQMQENVTELTQDGYKKETTIRNNSASIELIAKGLGEAQLKLQEDQIVALISKAINNGNSMQTMQVIIDILGLTIKNGGIKVYDGNNSLVLYVDQNSKKLVMNGSIESQSGHIGGWSLNSEGLTASYTANIPNYTSADTEKIKQFILGQITLTDAEYDYLDIDRSGTITSADYVIMKNVISGLHSHTWRYDYVISPYDPAKFVKVHIDMGNGTSRDRYISLMGISTDAMRYVNDKVRG